MQKSAKYALIAVVAIVVLGGLGFYWFFLRDDAPPELYGGWPMILSGLKTWLETGQTLTTPGSLMYGENPQPQGDE